MISRKDDKWRHWHLHTKRGANASTLQWAVVGTVRLRPVKSSFPAAWQAPTLCTLRAGNTQPICCGCMLAAQCCEIKAGNLGTTFLLPFITAITQHTTRSST